MFITHLWTRLTSKIHEDAWVERLRFAGPENLVIKAFPASRTLRLQVYTNQETSRKLKKLFGGSVRPFNMASWKPPEIKRRKPIVIAGGLRLHNDRELFLEDHKKKKGYPLLIPAEMAFGTGEHATTRGCLRILSEIASQFPQKNWSFLDLGMGSGILAFAAELFGAKKILGVDFDLRCVKVARANAKANELLKSQWLHADILKWKIPGTWNVIAANIYSSVLTAAAPKIVKALKPQGSLILSGIFAQEIPQIENCFAELGLKKNREIIQGKWGALWLKKS
ncbi:MAG: methyltransferase domain-containing protein [Verrucomicrobia bacterium]|nr:methyltransferase domain-containing protein [Verrucomicrobiota bacterium]